MKNKTTYNRAMHDKSHPYSLVSSALIESHDLTGEEKIMLIYMLNQADTYVINITYLIKNAKKLFGWGRDKTQNVWNSLIAKGYIQSEYIRDHGKFVGYRHTIHETLQTDLLGNRSTENPMIEDSDDRKTSILTSTNRTNTNITITEEKNTPPPTRTNLAVCPKLPSGVKKAAPGSLIRFIYEIQTVFKIIRDSNPVEHSVDWKLNNKDHELIRKAIDELGFMGAITRVYLRIQYCDKPYCSVSYIFSDMKEDESIVNLTDENIESTSSIIFDDLRADEAIKECVDAEELYNLIRSSLTFIHPDAQHWTPSQEDLEYCEILLSDDSNINIPEKLQHGLKSAFEKDDWRFGQIVYQAVTAVENKQLYYS